MRAFASEQPDAEPLPRLRADLAWSRRQVRGEDVWFLKDPARRTYFRFSDAVAFLLKRLDGSTSREALLRAYVDRFGGDLSSDELESLLQQAADADLLEEGGGADAQRRAAPDERRAAPESRSGPAERRPSLLSRLLHLHLGTFDPDALLGRLEARLRFLFTPTAFAAWTGLVLSALAVAAANLDTLGLEFEGLLRWETIPVLLPVLLLVMVLHEFGHGLACKHFGGEVREMGFLLIYFQPALYCDISDTWMLERRARLWSVAAGTWVQLALWSLAAFVWRVTIPESFAHAAALLVVVVAGTGALMNLIPFIKLDGYYLLSDGLEIPNLRARAFAHLRRRLLGALGAGPGAGACAGPGAGGATDTDAGAAAGDPLPPADRREARIFWLYGASAALLSGGLLLYLLLLAHGFTARHLGAGCVALLWVLVATLAARPVGALARPVGQSWADVLRRPRLSRPAAVLLTLLAAVAALFLVRWELRVGAEVRFEPLRRSVVRSEIEGIVERVEAAENREVREGDVLFELSSREYRAALEQAEAELLKARAELALLERGARAEELRNAESGLEKALTREEYSRRDHDKAQELYERKIIPLKDLLSTEEEFAVRQKEVKEARARLDLLRAGSRPEAIDRVRAEVSRLESLARVARENLDRARVRAPIAGRVVTPHVDLLLGQEVERGAALCELVDARRLRAELEIPEGEAAEVRAGQKVKIKARGYPGRSFWGEVVSVAPAAQADPAGKRAGFLPGPQSRIRVETEVDNAEGLLKPEMTGNAKIYCGRRPLVELLTRRLVRYVRTEFWF